MATTRDIATATQPTMASLLPAAYGVPPAAPCAILPAMDTSLPVASNWCYKEATTSAHIIYPHYMDHKHHHQEASNPKINQLKHHANVIDNIIKATCGEEWGYRTDMQSSFCGPVSPQYEQYWQQCEHQWDPWSEMYEELSAEYGVLPTTNEVWPAMNIDREVYNSDLANNSCFSLYNQSTVSQPDLGSTCYAETYSSSLHLQMSSEELMW